MQKNITIVLPEWPLHYGRLLIPSGSASIFPNAKETIKITVFLDDKKESIELTYNGKWGLIYGLGRWFKNHHAISGDKVLVRQLGEKRYIIKFIGKKQET